MIRIIGSIAFALLCLGVRAQEVDTLKQQQLLEVRIDENFDANYRQRLRQLRRTYPMALHAKSMIEEYEKELAKIEKRRKKKKYGKTAHKDLKEEFTFNIKDLYVGEGELLLRLIHRETGMTVSEIIKKYRGNGQNAIYGTMAKLWGHDLKSQYDPKGDDWITELIIYDIEHGHIPFDKEMKHVDKQAFKTGMKEYRTNKKNYKKQKRKAKRNKRRQQAEAVAKAKSKQ